MPCCYSSRYNSHSMAFRLHTVWVAALSATLFALVGAIVYCYGLPKKKKKKKNASRRVTPYTFQESELTRVQGQGWTCQVDGFCFFFCFVFDGADNPNDNGWLCLRAEYSDSCPYFRKRHSQSDFHISPLNVLSLCLKEKYYAHFQVHAFILGHY